MSSKSKMVKSINSDKAHAHILDISRFSPTTQYIVLNNGIIHLERKQDKYFFDSLFRTIVGQQLSKPAADTIWRRINNLANDMNISIEDLVTDTNKSSVLSCGLSTNKFMSVLGIKQSIEKNSFNQSIFKSTDSNYIKNEIIKFWGCGNWTAEMMCLFFFGLSDIWSENDAALRNGIYQISINDNFESDLLLDLVKPYRSYLALHIWKAIDTGLLSDFLKQNQT